MTVENWEAKSIIDLIDDINTRLSRIQAVSVLIANSPSSSNGTGHDHSIRVAAGLIHDEAEKAHEVLATAWQTHGFLGTNVTPLHQTA